MVDKSPAESAEQNVEIDAAQRERLRLPALGPERLRQLSVVTAGRTGICYQVATWSTWPHGLDQGRGWQDLRLPRHLVGNRLPHHHDQRPRRARLGRRRRRGGSRQPVSMLIPRSAWPSSAGGSRGEGITAGRPGADRHADAAQEGRGGEIRRVLRRRPGRPAPGGPLHHRQHGPGIRRHLRLLPGTRSPSAAPVRV